MATRTKAECFAGVFSAKSKYNGAQHVDESVEATTKTAHGHEVYAKHGAEYDQEAFNFARAKENIGKAKGLGKVSAAFEEATGVKWQHVATFFDSPASYLGEKFTNPILNKLEQLPQQYPEMTRAVYNREIKPLLASARAEVTNLDPMLQNKAYDWLNHIEKGGPYFSKGTPNPITKLAGNAVGNLITNNPAIALYNVFEFLPKAMAYSIQQVGPENTGNVLIKGISDYVKASGGIKSFWKRIPDLDAKGVYGSKETGAVAQWLEKKTGVSNILDLTENPLRGLSYYLGEAIQPSTGTKALEDIAFVYRPGNEPQMHWNLEGKATVSLMRFSVKTMQMYGGLVKSAVIDKNPRAAAALAAFHIMTAVQTGASSTIPAPVWAALPEDTKEQISQIEGLDSLIGLKLDDAQRPIGGLAFGLGYNIATSDLAALSKIPKAIKMGVEDGEWGNAAYEGSLGLLMAAQLGRIPGLNLSTVRLYKAAAKGWADNEFNAGYISQEYLEALKLAAKDE
jgi:hypothetical protein